MKQFTFFKTLLIAAVMLLGSGSVLSQETTYTFNSKSWGTTTSNSNWTSGKDGNQFTPDQGIQVTTGATGAYGTSPVSFGVTEVEVTYCTNKDNGVGTIEVFSVSSTSVAYDGGTQIGNTFNVTKPASGTGTTLKTVKFTPSSTETGHVRIQVTCSINSVYIHSVKITESSTPTPTITVNPATLSGFTYVHGNGPSAAQEFTVSGSNLTADISLAAPASYEISTSAGSGYGGSLSLTQSGGSVASTTIYARLKAGLAVGNYNGETVNITSSGATAKTVTLSGSVTAPPANIPVATAATAVGSTGFTANWNAVSGATSYLLSVHSGSVSLNEDFNSINGSGGNSGGWSGSIAAVPLSSFGNWVLVKVYAGDNCVKVGASGDQGSITTPELGLNGNATLTFRAGAWDGSAEHIKLLLEITGGGSLSVSSVTMIKGAFTNYSVNISGGTATTKITFKGEVPSNSRFFLDDVKVSNSTPITGSPFTVENGNYHDITGLTASTTYYYTVKAIGSWGVSAASNEISVTTLAASPVATFSGTGNWNDPSKWSPAGVPHWNTDVVINGNLTVNSTWAPCSNMTIASTGTVTVNSSDQLYIYNNLLIKSDANGTGSIININEGLCYVGGTTTIQRYLTGGWSEPNGGWHQISSPVASQAISAFTTTGTGNDYDFYGWDEPTDTWMNQKETGFNTWNGNSDKFRVGRGYLVSYEQSPKTLAYSGEMNTGDVTVSGLTKTGGTYSGWNLLGNPYPSAIKWNYGGSMTLTNIAATAKIWHSSNKSYSDIAPGEIIPSAQGFMVQALVTGAELEIKTTARVHDNQPFYKNTADNQVMLVAAEASGASAQESKLLLQSGATESFSEYHDSRFLAGYAPMFYSVCDNEYLSTYTLPSFEGRVIPFGFVKNEAEAFVITLKESPAGVVVFLTDKQNGTVTNLSESGSYEFTSGNGDNPDRFLVHFGSLGISTPGKADAPKIYAYQEDIYISGAEAGSTLTLTDITGRVIMSKRLSGKGLEIINAAGLPHGAYVVSVVNGNSIASEKVIM